MKIKPLPKHCKQCKQTCKLKSERAYARAMQLRAEQIKALPVQHVPTSDEIEKRLLARKNHILKMREQNAEKQIDQLISVSAYRYTEAQSIAMNHGKEPYHAESSKPVTGYRRQGEMRNGLFAVLVCRKESQFKPRTKRALKAERLTAHKLAYMLQPDRREYHDDSILDLTYTKLVKLSKRDCDAVQRLPDGMYTVVVRPDGIKVLIPVK